MIDYISASVSESIEVISSVSFDKNSIARAAELMIAVLKSGSKILICGNGGSASDAEHMAAELVGRFEINRRGAAAIALTPNSSITTAVSNDYGFSMLFSRQVEALGNSGDLLIGITTSGNSENVVGALETAKKMGLGTILFTGRKSGKAGFFSDLVIKVQSERTCRIQEAHILIIHILCGIVEKYCFCEDVS